MRIRTADAEDIVAAMNVLDGANLEVSKETVRRRLESGHVLVASGTVVSGVLVADPEPDDVFVSDDEGEVVHVEAIAVRRRRRGQGIGTRLLAAASARWGPISATFDPTVVDFYRSVGFEIRSVGERCYGVRV